MDFLLLLTLALQKIHLDAKITSHRSVSICLCIYYTLIFILMFIPDKTTKHRLPADLRYVNDCKVFTEGVYLDNVVQPDTVFVEVLLSDSSVQCFAEKPLTILSPIYL